jgi:hypothetical protein
MSHSSDSHGSYDYLDERKATSPDTEALVKRYNSANIMWSMDGAKLRHDPSGEWVRFSDYEAAEARVSALSAEVERLKTNIEAMAVEFEKSIGYDDDLRKGIGLETVGQFTARRIRASLNGGSDHG